MHPAIINASKLILVGDIIGAEKELSDIADQHGDYALAEILEEVPAKDLLAIMREYDSSKESVLSLMVTPEQFARAIVLDTQYGDRTKDKLRAMINLVIYKSADETADYLDAIYQTKPAGIETLADYFNDYHEDVFNFVLHACNASTTLPFICDDGSSTLDEIKEFFEVFHSTEHIIDKLKWNISRAEIADSDWKEAIWVLFHELADVFDHLILELQGRLLAKYIKQESKTISNALIEDLLKSIDLENDAEESAI
ncbi:hypothetical protein [Janthinobacterium sp. B9-8]|uniref:hypothetical protein n=1 Tax=Janthinobacterium sp. B9-8 TaxID=1236179 RepID=UPI0006992AEB|nr:hypothetical protein [Janthinobacterium sp. B9-8]AMC36909.1 hypothetical protein VN23_21130 [Janthinobacterium sp. B9-8]